VKPAELPGLQIAKRKKHNPLNLLANTKQSGISHADS
jgi:hypothetical protein